MHRDTQTLTLAVECSEDTLDHLHRIFFDAAEAARKVTEERLDNTATVEVMDTMGEFHQF